MSFTRRKIIIKDQKGSRDLGTDRGIRSRFPAGHRKLVREYKNPEGRLRGREGSRPSDGERRRQRGESSATNVPTHPVSMLQHRRDRVPSPRRPTRTLYEGTLSLVVDES